MQAFIKGAMMKHLLTSIFWGCLISAIGFGALYVFGQVVVLDCSRAVGRPVTCLKESRFMGIVTVGEEGLGEVTGAYVEENCDDDGCTYRVVLNTSRGSKPLTMYRSSGHRDKQSVADQINTYISAGAEDDLHIQVSSGFFGFLFPLALIVAGPVVTVGRILRGPRG
jgi:hypothetical protein